MIFSNSPFSFEGEGAIRNEDEVNKEKVGVYLSRLPSAAGGPKAD